MPRSSCRGSMLISVLCREGAGRRDAFDIGEQQATGGQRHNAFDITQPQRRAFQGGQASGNISRDRHPKRGKPKHGSGDDRQRHNAERNRFAWQQALAEHQQHDRDEADRKYEVAGLAELPGEQHSPLKKIMPSAGHANQARQLGHRDGQPRTGLESDQHAVADQLYEHAQSQQPGDQAKHRHREAGEAGDLRIVLRISTCHVPNSAGNHERDGGGRSDRQLARRPEQSIAEPAQQVAIYADLRRQAGKSRIGKRNGDRVGGQRDPGDDITAQPGGAIFRQPTCRRQFPHRSVPTGRRILHACTLVLRELRPTPYEPALCPSGRK